QPRSRPGLSARERIVGRRHCPLAARLVCCGFLSHRPPPVGAATNESAAARSARRVRRQPAPAGSARTSRDRRLARSRSTARTSPPHPPLRRNDPWRPPVAAASVERASLPFL